MLPINAKMLHLIDVKVFDIEFGRHCLLICSCIVLFDLNLLMF